MRYTHTNKGTCSRGVSFDMDDAGTVTGVKFEGGCNGNTKGIAALCEGQSAENLIKILSGIQCGIKGTSCPDQLARALYEARNGK